MQQPTFRQMNYNVFSGAANPHVLFQPRIEPWFDWHRTFDNFPDGYGELHLLDVFDNFGMSMRYIDYYTGMEHPFQADFDDEVKIRTRRSDGKITTIYETPYGELTEVRHRTIDRTWRTMEFAIKEPADFKKLRWLAAHTIYTFDRQAYENGSRFMGERGVPQFWTVRSPYQALAIDWMKYEQFIYALADYPDEIVATIAALNASHDALYTQIVDYGQCEIINFGENVHGHLMTRQSFEELMMPYYTQRANQLREAGIYTHIHIDGAVKPLLPLLKDLPFDGIEALTPEPQGDVTLEEIKEHIGDKVLLDVIPAVLFMETFSRDQLMQTVEKIVELFHPRLVLGISDEIPQGTGLEGMERVKLVAEWARSHG